MASLMAGHKCPHPEAFRGQGEPCAVAHPGRYVCHECGKTHKVGGWPHPIRARPPPTFSDKVLDLAWERGITRSEARKILGGA